MAKGQADNPTEGRIVTAGADGIVRVAVTQQDVANFRGGIKRPGVTTGPVNQMRAAQARNLNRGRLSGADMVRAASDGTIGTSRHKAVVTTFGPRSMLSATMGARTAGMMLDSAGMNMGTVGSSALSAYHTSYASGNIQYGGGIRDVPAYFMTMNENNGGLIYWPVSLREKYEWYRYFARTDSYVGRSLELLADLPMSKITLNMPKMEGKKRLRQEIQEFFTYMCEHIGLFEKLQQILWEYNLIGNVFVFHEWDAKMKMWSKAVVLPPEEVNVFQYPFSDVSRVEYRPEKLIQLIQQDADGLGASDDDMTKNILKGIPKELKAMVKKEGCIVMDSDPMTGSFVHHLARRRSPYLDLGASVLERILVPMLMKEHYRYTQLGLASRNMTPKNLISAEGLTPGELDDLRAQVDLSYMDPDYSVVTNYPVQWDQIGADARLLDLDTEYERIENQVFAGLGTTRELLTGEGSFSGSKITIEILNTMFLLVRQTLQRYVERQLFLPVCEAHGWYEKGKHGIKKYYYPKLGFNRLTIRDNQEVFDSLFQLYQKGSLPVDIIYELFNLNTDDIHERIFEDLFTVKDSNFNRIIEDLCSEIGRALAERSDATEKVGKYLKLTVSAGEDEGGYSGFGGDFSGFGDTGGGSEPSESEEPDVEAEADEIADTLDVDATDEEIAQAIEDAGSEEAGAEADEQEA